MFTFTPAAPSTFPSFGAPAPSAQQQQRGDACGNPFGGGLSTRECFRVNEDKRFGVRETATPTFSWPNKPAATAPASSGFSFPRTGDNRGLFGSTEKPAPTTGWHFGGNASLPRPPVQPSTFTFSGGPAKGFGSAEKPPSTTGWHFGGTAPQPPAQASNFMLCPTAEKGGLFGSTSKPTTGWRFGGTDTQPSAWSKPTFPRYAPTVERDPISGNCGKMVSISSMPAYSTQSVEELRFNHAHSPVFGQTVAVTNAPTAETSAWTTEKGATWTGWTPPRTVFGVAPQTNPFRTATNEAGRGVSDPSNPFGRVPSPPSANSLTGNPFAPQLKPRHDPGHFHFNPPPTPNPKPTWPVFPSATSTGIGEGSSDAKPKADAFHFRFDAPVTQKPTWPVFPRADASSVVAVGSSDEKPANGFAPFRFGGSETVTPSASLPLFGQPSLEAPVTEPEPKGPEQPVAVPDEDFPYGSGDFGAGLVEQTVKAALSKGTAKPESNDPLALPVVSSQQPVSRKIGGSRATAFLRRSTVSNNKALLAHGIHHSVTVPRKPTSSSSPAKKPTKRIVVGRRDAEPWQRGGLQLTTSLFAKSIGSAAVALTAAHGTQENDAADKAKDVEEPVAAGPAIAVDVDLDNYDL